MALRNNKADIIGVQECLDALDEAIDALEMSDVPLSASNGDAETNVSAEERGNAVFKQTVLTFTDLVVPVGASSSSNGVGSKLLYTFPANNCQVLGAGATLTARIATAKQADFVDGDFASPAELALGSVTLGSDTAIDDDPLYVNLGDIAEVDIQDYETVSPIVSAPKAASVLLESSGEVYLNILIPAADIVDDVSTEILVSGTVTITWMNLGI